MKYLYVLDVEIPFYQELKEQGINIALIHVACKLQRKELKHRNAQTQDDFNA